MKYKHFFFIASIVQMFLARPLDGTKYITVFGLLAIIWAIVALFYPPLYPNKNN